jgi:hypothetical protein
MSDLVGNAELLSTRRVAVPEHVVFRAFAKETVLLNVQTGQYHGLDRIGSRFFVVIRDAPNLGTASEQLASEYGQPLERITGDLVTFCNDLMNRGLVQITAAAP